MKTLFINTKTILTDGVTNDAVLVENGKITYIGKAPENTEGMRVIDGDGLYLSPGFVDIHVHGGGGHGVMDCDPEGIVKMCDAHLAHGTTSIVPTTLASPIKALQDAICAVRDAQALQKHKTILGVHLEGPFLAPSQKGAQSEDSILPITEENVSALLNTWDKICMIGAAPELDNIELLCKKARERGITLTVAHSDASYDEVVRAVELGFTDVTHIYSASSTVIRKNGFRVAGVVEAGLVLDGLSVTAITDLCHLPPALLALIYKCKGAGGMSLITDALDPAGTEMESGTVIMQKNGVPAIYEDGVMKLADRTAFAGSVATMDRLVKNMRDTLRLPIYEAVKMASATPASVIGAGEKGKICVGYDADLLLFDENISIFKVFCKGQEVTP